jgi:hypothetical protein
MGGLDGDSMGVVNFRRMGFGRPRARSRRMSMRNCPSSRERTSDLARNCLKCGHKFACGFTSLNVADLQICQVVAGSGAAVFDVAFVSVRSSHVKSALAVG